MVTNLHKLFFFIVLCAFLLSSCSLQKRLYTKGFYTSKKHSLQKPGKQLKSDTSYAVLNNIQPIIIKQNAVSLSAELRSSLVYTRSSKLTGIKLLDACDTIVLRNGARLLGKVEEIHHDKITFKNCNASIQPNATINSTLTKKEVNYIVFSNGYKEVFELNSESNSQQSQQTNGFSIAGLVLSIINFPISIVCALFSVLFNLGVTGAYNYLFVSIPIFIALLAITCCIIGIIQISKNISSQDGLAASIVGLALSVLLLAIIIAILVATA